MDFHLTPLIRTPLTDLGAYLIGHQEWGPCAKAEMKAMNCLEAYGVHRGRDKCADLINDYRECFTSRTQIKRTKMMRLERSRQYYLGERKQRYMEDIKSTSY